MEAKNYVELSLGVVSESSDLMSVLNMLNSYSDFVYAHSLGVSIYSVMIAKQMGIESTNTYFKLGLAGLYHDIGKKEIDKALIDKPRHLLNSEERKTVEMHAVRGQEILGNFPNMPSDVIQMTLEHHEDNAGQGYPLHKSRLLQHPLSKILQCANIFVEQTLAGPSSGGKSAITACEFMEKILADRIDPECLKALKALFSLK
jgi:putative nucleotidyltransferase with HDIG domain